MGVESIGGVTGAASYQAQPVVAKPVKTEVVDSDRMSAQVQSEASSQPVLNAKVEANSQGSDASDAEGQSKQQATQDEGKMKNAAKDINKLINQNTIAEFGYHEATKRITIKIKDKETDEVIKEIPSEKALEMLTKAWELAGIMVDERR